MKSLVPYLICTTLAFPVVPVSAAPISFMQAWEVLQKDNNSLAAERENVSRYRYLKDATDNLSLPRVSIGANYTRLDDNVTLSGKKILDNTKLEAPAGTAATLSSLISSINQELAALGGVGTTTTISKQDVVHSSIRAMWPIFTGGRISAAQSAAEGKQDEAASQLQMETLARYEDLAKYYFSVVLTKEVLTTRQAVEAGLAKHRNNAVKLEQQGQIAHVERLQADVALDKATIERKKAQKNVNIAQSALTTILGQDAEVEPKDTLFTNRTLPPMSAFTEQTLATYPGLSILDAKEKQATSLRKSEQGKYYPNVYLYGSYNLYEDDSIASQLKPDWVAGIGVSIPLIESTGRSDRAKAASSAISQIHYLRAQAHEDLSVLVQKTYQQAGQALEEVDGLNSSIALAKENLRLRQKAFNQGLSTSLDVVDAELYKAQVQTQQAVASYHYLIALTKLLALSSEVDTFSHYRRSALRLHHTPKTAPSRQTEVAK
ncbi:TolC family protein [Vibrio palustris]|uniref:Outer membrane efflux protein n=1 Tax=Vibrio palustris TaxID=1918946 RepID=A0A1R4B281_9VIBR|nr:Outer membrane efflux protein [Vibrio palustris]